MKIKNTASAIALTAVVSLLILLLAGCSFNVGPLKIDISLRVPGHFNFNEKQPDTKNENPGDNQNLRKPGNIEDIPFMGIEMTQSQDTRGVLVESVIAESPADEAGIKPQDIITVFDGREVARPSELYAAVQRHKAGDTVKMTVSRNGQDVELTVTLGAFIDSMPDIIGRNNRENFQKPETESSRVY